MSWFLVLYIVILCIWIIVTALPALHQETLVAGTPQNCPILSVWIMFTFCPPPIPSYCITPVFWVNNAVHGLWCIICDVELLQLLVEIHFHLALASNEVCSQDME